MHRLVFLFAVSLTLLASAAPRPLSVKDVSLMLRSGYSSESILREIAARKMVDVPNETARKSLVEFGASAELIGTLEKGEFQVDEATAADARRTELDTSARQAAETQQVFRDATAILREQKTRSATARNSSGPSVLDLLKGKLAICRGDAVSPLDPAALEDKRLIAFYYSAHWCPPCRTFTPQLVDYYNRIKPDHPEFELIFVSFDRSRFNWEGYMREAKMPWPAIDFDQLPGLAGLRKKGGASIPSLLVLDRYGRTVASSYEGEQYVGPQNALAALDRIFASAGGTE